MKFYLILIAVILSYFVSCGAARGESYEPIMGHPRLLLHSGEETKVTETIARIPEIKNVHDSIIRLCDRMIDWPLLERKLTGVRLLNVSYEAMRRIFYLSYGYRMTGDRRYSERAIKEMLNVCSFSDWHPSHFLDVAEMTMAVAIGYDWLYGNISEADRRIIATAVREKAFASSKINKYNYFYRKTYNWNQVCNAGLLYGAIAFKDEFPEETNEMIRKCLESNPKALDTYLPDGGYPEGYGYWSYGTTAEVLLIDALLTTFGTDFGIIPPKGFLNTAKYMTFMTAPSGRCFNFSDTRDKAHGNIASWWFAAHTGDTSLLGEEMRYLSSGDFKVGEIRLLPALPVFASRINDIDTVKMSGNFWISHGATPVFIYRGGWDSDDDPYLAVKGGSPSTTHAHMDAGSFVYEHNGVRWASDLGLQDYNSLESKGVNLWDTKQDGQRWDILRMSNLYHNTLTINNAKHVVESHAPIIHTFTSNDQKGAVVDLTATLGVLRCAHRSVCLNSYNHLFVTDSITTGEDSADLMWVMVTETTPRIINDTIVLSKNGKEMRMTFESLAKIETKIWTNEPIHDYDAPNHGTMRVGFETVLPPDSTLVIRVRLSPCKN